MNTKIFLHFLASMWGGRTDLLGLAREFECEVEVWCGGGGADGALARLLAGV